MLTSVMDAIADAYHPPRVSRAALALAAGLQAAGAVDPSAYAMVLATVVASTILVPPFVRWRAG